MNAPVLTYTFDPAGSPAFPELSEVRLLQSVETDDGVMVPAGAEGTVLSIWDAGAGYEVEFDTGLATVEAALLMSAAVDHG